MTRSEKIGKLSRAIRDYRGTYHPATKSVVAQDMNAPKNCSHLSVQIRRIIRAFTSRTQSRTIGGECDDCGATVKREHKRREVIEGKFLTDWELA